MAANVIAKIATDIVKCHVSSDGEEKFSSLQSSSVAAASSPTTAGRKPLNTLCTNGDFMCLRNILLIRIISTNDGSISESVAIKLPSMPSVMFPVALCTAVYPQYVALFIPIGPGVIWDMATMLVNSAELSQW